MRRAATCTAAPDRVEYAVARRIARTRGRKSVIVTRQISAPADRVEALKTDLEHAAEHIDGIEKVELLSDGPFGVGTHGRETRVMVGKDAAEEMGVTEPAPHDHDTVEAASHGMHYRSVFRFAPRDTSHDRVRRNDRLDVGPTMSPVFV